MPINHLRLCINLVEQYDYKTDGAEAKAATDDFQENAQ